MMGALSLAFGSPLVLLALGTLPALWLLFRLNPPRPRLIPFPPLALIRDSLPKTPEARRLPLWLLILRLILMGLVILAMAGPMLVPSTPALTGTGPALIVIDSGWAAARDWPRRIAAVETLLLECARANRPVALIASGEAETAIEPEPPGKALDRLRGLEPRAFLPDHARLVARIDVFLTDHPDAALVYVTDGVALGGEAKAFERLATFAFSTPPRIIRAETPPEAALAGLSNGAAGLGVRVVRADLGSTAEGNLRAFDRAGRAIGEGRYRFDAGAFETEATIALPTDLRNEITRIERARAQSTGDVALVDGTLQRRRVGIVSGAGLDVSQPLLSPAWYVARALEPHADLIEPRGGTGAAVAALIEAKVGMIVLADPGMLAPDLVRSLDAYLAGGGVVLRFGGPRLAAEPDVLLPVRLRHGDRALGGALSWESPRMLAPIPATSPFAGLDMPAEVTVTRQLLAEPDTDLKQKTWAALADGTPVVTAETRGRGRLILFHVTADTRWSNLPLSGLFVAMLERILPMARAGGGEAVATASSDLPLAPDRTLNGHGVLGVPPATAKPALRAKASRADLDHPAGFYGAPDAPFALNALGAEDRLAPLDLGPLNAETRPLDGERPVDLRPVLLLLVALAFAADTLGTLLIRGGFRRRNRFRDAGTVALALILVAGLAIPNGSVRAEVGPVPPKDAEGALKTHLAYVVTGDAGIDETSRAGLKGLSDFVAAHTALEAGEPVGVDPAIDDLAVYPLIYWPMAPGRALPGAAAIARIDAFMKNGGTMLFDTRDAALSRPGSDGTPETRMLRQILDGLSIPALEPVPPDHVLTKAFYLVNRFPGRYAEGPTWIEALPRTNGEDGAAADPARGGDGVSPILISSNDLASAWASGRDGEPLYPTTQSMPRQREMAMRGGTNIVMYTLTGNYKADQVHVPALLERLAE